MLTDRFDGLRRRAIHRTAIALVKRRADRFLAWAPHVRDSLVASGISQHAVFVQPRGVSLELFRFRPPPSRTGEPLRILSNRLLKPLYGVEVLVRALALLRDRSIRFDARICGDGLLRGHLEALAGRLAIADAITFVGTVPGDRMSDELAWTDVYVSTSYTDGASSSLFEAMAVGRFPVITDLPANQPYVEDGVSGMLFPPGDVEALATQLEQLAGRRDLLRSGGERSRALAEEKLDYLKNMEAIENVLLEVAKA